MFRKVKPLTRYIKQQQQQQQQQQTKKQGTKNGGHPVAVMVGKQLTSIKAHNRTKEKKDVHMNTINIDKLRDLNWVLISHRPWCTVTFHSNTSPYLKNLIFFSNIVKELFEPIVLQNKQTNKNDGFFLF